jgi:hypothetical protein
MKKYSISAAAVDISSMPFKGNVSSRIRALEETRLSKTFYTTNGFFADSPKSNDTQVDSSLLGLDNERYPISDEAYMWINCDLFKRKLT